MAWTDTYWEQDNDKNNGFPIPIELILPEDFTFDSIYTPWITNGEENPYIISSISDFTFDSIYTPWITNGEENPYIISSISDFTFDLIYTPWSFDSTEEFNSGYPYMQKYPYLGAFANCRNLKEIVIPKTVKKLGQHTFRGTSLTQVTIASDCEYGPETFPPNCIIKFYN